MSAYENLKTQLQSKPHTWLITGAPGFIGSNLLEALLQLNRKVVGLENFSTGHHRNMFEVQSMITPAQWQNFCFMQADISNSASYQTVCTSVDYVLQQAALGSVPRIVEDPITTNASNVTGFPNMLASARNAEVKRFVYTASSSSNDDHPSLPKVEDQIGNPLSPFAVTKYVNGLYSDVFGKAYGRHYFNVIDPRQDPDGAYAVVISEWVAGMIKGEPVYTNGDGETNRDFFFIANVVQANQVSARTQNTEAANQVYNIAVGGRTTLNELFEQLKQNLISACPHLKDAQAEYRDFPAGGLRHSLASIFKARERLRYEPTQNIEQRIKLAMPWYTTETLQ